MVLPPPFGPSSASTSPVASAISSPRADRVVWITDGEIVAFDVHDQFLCMLARSQMKNGVPTTAVRMPSGISTSAAVRARVSMTSR